MAFVYWYIRDFFSFIGGLLSFVLELLWTLIEVLISVVEFFGSLVASLPFALTASITALVIICVLYKVLGRESTG